MAAQEDQTETLLVWGGEGGPTFKASEVSSRSHHRIQVTLRALFPPYVLLNYKKFS